MKQLWIAPLFFAALAGASSAPPQNSNIDFAGFLQLSNRVSSYREARLIRFDDFQAKAHEKGALLLDARSADAFAAGHIKGAVNLPLTDFTADSLARTIGKRDRPILIYCNNNFSNDEAPVRLKAIQLALNIQTFVNLVGYGYSNVYELAEVVDFNDPRVGWVKG